MLLLLAALVVFAAGARIGHFILLAVVGLPDALEQVDGSAAIALRRMVFTWIRRIDPAGVGYQINQALIALGSGGVFGRGFGHGVQKFGFLPEPHNDFLLAMIGEEWGFVGVVGADRAVHRVRADRLPHRAAGAGSVRLPARRRASRT